MSVLAGHHVVNEAVGYRPPAALRWAVAAYDGYRQRNVAPAVHIGLPSPYLTLIFTLDEPLEMARHVDPSRAPGAYGSLLGGLHTSPALITHDGAQSGIQLRIEPLAARALLGLPAGPLAGYDGDATEALGPLSAEICDRLRAAPTWADRFTVLDDILIACLAKRSDVVGPPAAVEEAWRILVASRGLASINTVADAVGYSDRRLTSLFVAELGLTPKAAARVIRFDGARRALQRSAATGQARIAGVAAAHGYYDQSHLVRDFTQFAGLPPSRWLAQEFGNVQATDDDEPAQ